MSVDGLVALSVRRRGTDPCPAGPARVAVDPDGALVELVSARREGPCDLVGGGRALGRVGHRNHDAADHERWFSTWQGDRPEDRDWARWDNTSPASTGQSGAWSAWYAPTWSVPGRVVATPTAAVPAPRCWYRAVVLRRDPFAPARLRHGCWSATSSSTDAPTSCRCGSSGRARPPVARVDVVLVRADRGRRRRLDHVEDGRGTSRRSTWCPEARTCTPWTWYATATASAWVDRRTRWRQGRALAVALRGPAPGPGRRLAHVCLYANVWGRTSRCGVPVTPASASPRLVTAASVRLHRCLVPVESARPAPPPVQARRTSRPRRWPLLAAGPWPPRWASGLAGCGDDPDRSDPRRRRAQDHRRRRPDLGRAGIAAARGAGRPGRRRRGAGGGDGLQWCRRRGRQGDPGNLALVWPGPTTSTGRRACVPWPPTSRPTYSCSRWAPTTPRT